MGPSGHKPSTTSGKNPQWSHNPLRMPPKQTSLSHSLPDKETAEAQSNIILRKAAPKITPLTLCCKLLSENLPPHFRKTGIAGVVFIEAAPLIRKFA